MTQFLKIKSEGGGSAYDYTFEIEFIVKVDDFTGFVKQDFSDRVLMGLSNVFDPDSNTGITTLQLEVADSTGVDTNPRKVVEETIMKTILSKPSGKFLTLTLPENYAVTSWQVTGYVA
tara:strand:+ start:1201 stop:1554 length:354 start_codon:yes stop_codon:yes gene_type:complete